MELGKVDLDTIVVALLTVLGFWLQYCNFEGKLSKRDKRDLFIRTVDEPMCQLLRELDKAVSLAHALIRAKDEATSSVLFTLLMATNRDLARTVNRLSKGKYDFGEGWISVDLAGLEDATALIDHDLHQPVEMKKIISEIALLDRDFKVILDGCRSKVGI
ncbi:hypothetical protein SAMN05216227_11022 [Pseudorhodobacter antarcticus]|uniref:Uncharacterized protein n=1 Tax=Pseudorhodobacter antarcticus TaxID=1077947 RepID=A0A1H8NTL3_9RHOB|nr:hypothetical protein [Pseudorhodobacter antarcticus]SEO32975.1 hypothetical protein SAMN05216227_11022 [Pseudorhodobacter antarcticus]